MKTRKKKYTDEPIGRVEVISDFLPSPDELVLKEDTVKVTLTLTKESVDFFKAKAGLLHTQYQKMIRELVHQYAKHHSKK